MTSSKTEYETESGRGFDAKEFLRTVPDLPGVYRMYDAKGTIIYVGKAKILKNRLRSYFVGNGQSTKTKALVSNISHIEFTVAPSESDALILEQNLIKANKPRYNILLRDDKSYPYILMSSHEYPRLAYHRGPKKEQGKYYGPYPNSSAVKDSLKILQNIFPVRQCSDNVFANRSRPCLMYQIKKCLGPCVKGCVSDEEYSRNVSLVNMFLNGKFSDVLDNLTLDMQSASDDCRFEEAAALRDQIFALRKVQEKQSIDNENIPDVDVIAVEAGTGLACVNAIYHRNGRMIGSRNYFLKSLLGESAADLLRAFVENRYSCDESFGHPTEIVVAEDICPDEDFARMMTEASGREIKFAAPKRGARFSMLSMAIANAKTGLASKLKSSELQTERIEDLEKLFGLDPGSVRRMECYDISHTMGERTVASQVVFGRNGPETSLYRLFNIEGITAGDDFAAMDQVLRRRFLHPSTSENFPDILFIDGGDGQLSQGESVMTEVRQKFPEYKPLVIGVSKGEGRKHGLETLHFAWTRETLNLPFESKAFLLIQHIRDESHRFAIENHRKQRSSHKISSVLEKIPGVGPAKRRALLNRFGGLREITSASEAEIAKVPGISVSLAAEIYKFLH